MRDVYRSIQIVFLILDRYSQAYRFCIFEYALSYQATNITGRKNCILVYKANRSRGPQYDNIKNRRRVSKCVLTDCGLKRFVGKEIRSLNLNVKILLLGSVAQIP